MNGYELIKQAVKEALREFAVEHEAEQEAQDIERLRRFQEKNIPAERTTEPSL